MGLPPGGGMSISRHIRADNPEEPAEKLEKSGIPLNAGKSQKTGIGIKPSSRAQELLSGAVKTEHDMLDVITGMVEKARSQRAVAEALGISDSYLNDVLQGKRSVGAALVRRLGYGKVTVFVAPDGGRDGEDT
jgi:hypothetical protein